MRGLEPLPALQLLELSGNLLDDPVIECAHLARFDQLFTIHFTGECEWPNP